MRNIRRILLATAALLLLFALFAPSGPSVPDGSILVLDVAGPYVEGGEPSLVSRMLGSRTRPFVSLLSEISKAERDERLSTVVFRIRDLQIGWGKAEELRAAIAAASGRGRKTAAFLELESFSGNLEYFVASGAQQVYASPASRAPLVGLAAEYVFLGGLWDRLGVEVEVERIGRYKSAAESMAGREMSDATREMANSLLDSVDESFVAGIAEGRRLPPGAVREAVSAAPIDGPELVRWGLVDGVVHEDELLEQLAGSEVLRGKDYAGVDASDVGFSPVAQFALVYGTGGVVVGSGSMSPDGSPVLASDSVSEAIEKAAADPNIEAVIFRIDSPGGSPLASDIVFRAIRRAQASGKPVIASFSDVAASGGYYVAAGADAIVATPTSITGSIGVFVLHPVIAGTLDKLGIGFASLTRGPHADLQLSTRKLTPGSRERLRAEVTSIYDLFVERVADGRPLDTEQVDAIARGRVWTGAQAAERGLVDSLGGLHAAVLEGKRRAGIDEDADVALLIYPPPRSLYQQLDDLLRGLRHGWSASLPVPATLRGAQPWLEALAGGRPTALLPFLLEIH
jgi:protease-4